MRFTITPLGGGRRDLGAVVDAIVDYLRPKSAGVVSPPSEDGSVTRYYADGGEEPGRWLGAGARVHGLAGIVDEGDLASVLSGRDPRTGERLITAQGSAGRRAELGAGRASRLGPEGERLYDVADSAAALGVTQREVARLLDVGTAIALGRLVVPPTGDRENHRARDRAHTMSQVRGSYLVPVVHDDGSRYVAERELARCAEARADHVDPDLVRALGDDDDVIPLAEAARIVGVTTQYLRRLAAAHETDRDRIERQIASGQRPRRAYLVAERGTRDQWLVRRRELVAFAERRVAPAVRVGYDLTLTTEKSLGVLALLSGPAVGREVLGAIQHGNDTGLRWLEGCAARTRSRGESVVVDGWTVASFRHLTSRALDPFPHHHNVIANSVETPDGERRALDARHLYRHGLGASAIATAEMRHRLTTRLGVSWRRGRKGGWEIDGIDDVVISEFSRRRGEIDEALVELEEALGRGADPREVEDIVLRTRPAKTHTPARDLVASWMVRAQAVGLDAAALASICGEHARPPEPAAEEVWARLARSDGICASGSVFDRDDVLTALVDLDVGEPDAPRPLIIDAAGIETLADRFLASDHVVRLRAGPEPAYTTVEMLEVQRRIAKRYATVRRHASHEVAADIIDGALERAQVHLTDEQRGLVRAWCRAGRQHRTAIGRAGAGKTTTVAACTDAWQAAGLRVLGAAVKGEAARTLAAATGADCETVAWYLAHDDPQDLPLDARTVLMVDEASTLSDRDLDALMTMAERTGASLRLIGDPAQHGSVAAGGMFRVLCERHPTTELRSTHRTAHEGDRAAAEALRSGRIDEALDHLAEAGHLHVVDDELAVHRDVLGRWWAAHLVGDDHPMVDRRNVTRHRLNRLAHVLLRANGEVGEGELVATTGRRFSVGDRVAARRPDRSLHVDGDRHAYVRNGAQGTVLALSDGGLAVAFDGIGTVQVPRSFVDGPPPGLDLAYALTSYAVQGSTYPVSTSRIDPGATRAETYVDITRGRSANHLYVTQAPDPLSGEMLPRAPSLPAEQATLHHLERSTGELTAFELAVRETEAGRAAPSR